MLHFRYITVLEGDKQNENFKLLIKYKNLTYLTYMVQVL